MGRYELLGVPVSIVDAILIDTEEDEALILARGPDGEETTIETSPEHALAIPESTAGPWHGAPVYYKGEDDE